MQPKGYGSLATRARTLVVALALVGLGYQIARARLPDSGSDPAADGNAGRSQSESAATAIPQATTPRSEQVTVTMHSQDIPGCHPEGRLFRTEVETQWRDKHSVNEIEYRWKRAASSGDGVGPIEVRVAGQAKVAAVKVGEALPKLTLNLPLEPAPLRLKLNTLVFERWSDDGQACFIWESPPDTPRPYEAEPITPGTTQAPRSGAAAWS